MLFLSFQHNCVTIKVSLRYNFNVLPPSLFKSVDRALNFFKESISMHAVLIPLCLTKYTSYVFCAFHATIMRGFRAGEAAQID